LIGDPERAELIARTETMRASNEGQQEAWDQAVEEGLLTGNEQQEWIVTPDDRLCPSASPSTASRRHWAAPLKPTVPRAMGLRCIRDADARWV
jgi:hypothetical protein